MSQNVPEQPDVKAKQHDDDTEGHVVFTQGAEPGVILDQPSADGQQGDEDDTAGHARADW